MDITPLLTAMGLGGAAGLNLHLPLLALGLADRFTTWVNLPQPYAMLGDTLVLIGLGVLAVLEILADKVPGLDHAIHLAGMVAHPIAGGVLFLATTQGVVDPRIAFLAGLFLAGATHAARAAARPAATAFTGGTGNAVASSAEDAASVGLSVTAIFAPILSVIMLCGIFGAGVWMVSRLRRLKGPKGSSA
jgi:nitrate reductase NapE component